MWRYDGLCTYAWRTPGYTKYCHFVCEWDCMNRRKKYCIQKEWPKCTLLVPKNENVIKVPLVDPKKVFLRLGH